MAGGFEIRGTGAGTSGQTFAGAVGQFARRTERRMTEIPRAAALIFFEAVTVGNAYSTGTQVDTGYALGSWSASLNAPSTTLPLGAAPTDRTARYTFDPSRAARVVRAWQPATQALWIQNPVGYVALLEFGLTIALSADRPPGWVGRAERQWPQMIGEATRTIRDESRLQAATNFAGDADRLVPARERI